MRTERESEMSEEQSNGNGEGDLGGVHGADTAVRVLSALIDMGAPLTLKAVCERAEMQPPEAHGYLVSSCRSGLAERVASGGYRLGPLAVRLGLAALRHLNVTQVDSVTLATLRDELRYTTVLVVWGGAGPTFVRFEETNDALIISGRPGSVMPLPPSCTGRVFLSNMPRIITEGFLHRELAGIPHSSATPSASGGKMTMANLEAMIESVRPHMLAQVLGHLSVGQARPFGAHHRPRQCHSRRYYHHRVCGLNRRDYAGQTRPGSVAKDGLSLERQLSTKPRVCTDLIGTAIGVNPVRLYRQARSRLRGRPVCPPFPDRRHDDNDGSEPDPWQDPRGQVSPAGGIHRAKPLRPLSRPLSS
jgi:DNA-binding IclR family transcriptional regulator